MSILEEYKGFKMKKHDGRDWKFQFDYDTKYTSKLAREFLNSIKVNLKELSSLIPYINLIENVMNILAREFNKNFTNAQADLIEAIEKLWEN